MSDEMTMDELFGLVNDERAVAEANRSDTIKTGGYIGKVVEKKLRKGDREAFDNGDPNPNFGRKYATLTVDLYQEEARKGRIYVDLSWEERRNDKGYLDGMSKRYGQLVKALDSPSSVGDTLEAAGQYPLYFSVTESFRTPEGWRTVKAEDEETAAEYRAAGYEAKNFVQRIGKVK